MAKEVDSDYNLPVKCSGLSFDSNDFFKKSFSVDHFLQEHRNVASLETLRDDLGVYLRILRSAMIELINKDYADFVNLSTNLIGLDRSISAIQSPLGQLKEEVLQVKMILDEGLQNVAELLKQRHDIGVRKQCLQNLARVEFLLDKFNGLLKLGNEVYLKSDVAERAAAEYNQLQFSVSKCDAYLTDVHKEKTKMVCDLLVSSLNRMFLESLKTKDTETLIQCLRIYAALAKIKDVETLYRKKVISPILNDIINETSLHSDPLGLNGIYNRLMDFLKIEMDDLLELTVRGTRFPVIKCYNFVVNSFWPEVEERLEIHLSSIFAPGNPELFYKNFTETMTFLEKVESYCGSADAVKLFHNHPQYLSFAQRWNLPVYFQIRFQEIGSPLEAVMENQIMTSSVAEKSDLKLLVSEVAWKSLLQCWSDGVFLRQLTHRFWKLSLQILSRYNTWINEVIRDSISEDTSINVSSATEQGTYDSTVIKKLQFFVYLYCDTQNLVKKLPEFWKIVLCKLGKISVNTQKILEGSLLSSEQQLTQQLPRVANVIVDEVSHHSIIYLRQVNDIPRLYRRTKRDMPTKPCQYVLQILAPPAKFCSVIALTVPRELLDHWLLLIFSRITQQFYVAVADVLTSVQKTEESLRRLKKIRDKSSSNTSTDGKGVGDDDKIKRQLFLDVWTFREEVENKGLKTADVDKLQELTSLVEEAQLKIEK